MKQIVPEGAGSCLSIKLEQHDSSFTAIADLEEIKASQRTPKGCLRKAGDRPSLKHPLALFNNSAATEARLAADAVPQAVKLD